VGRRTGEDRYDPAVEGMGVQMWAWATREECTRAWGSDPQRLRELFGPAMLIDNTGWAVDAAWEAAEDGAQGTILPGGTVRASAHVARYRAFLKALWRLLDEEIAQMDNYRDKAAARRAQRLGRIPGDGDVVRVVRLRKISWAEDPDRRVPLPELVRAFTHRWWRRAHWRHLQRGMGVLEGDTILLDTAYRWAADVHLRLTDAAGRRERATIAHVTDGVATLAWTPNLAQGMVEVERLAHVREHTAGAEFGFLVERYDVHVLER
jgi:hypothetical protein